MRSVGAAEALGLGELAQEGMAQGILERVNHTVNSTYMAKVL